MKTNKKTVKPPVFTHEGARAKAISPEAQLRRTVMACMLFENEFYEDGVEISQRVRSLIPLVDPLIVAQIAIQARTDMKLRHVPLLIVREMARIDSHKSLVGDILPEVIQRADELSEFLAIYWKEGRQPLSKQVKLGLARAFTKFDEYQLAKYNRDADVTLRDVLFLSHPHPNSKAQEKLWKKLVDGKLDIPATWETLLSAGADKAATFEVLIDEGKLGALALLRNLRNMQKAGVADDIIRNAINGMNASRVLPFRFIAAAKYAPAFERELEEALFRNLMDRRPLVGKTALLIDVSASMSSNLSRKSDMTRMDAAAALAIVLREVCPDLRVFTFSYDVVEVAARRGFALRDAVIHSQHHGGTYLGKAVNTVLQRKPDRLIVASDEQSQDPVPNPNCLAYMINVASNQNGVGYGPWIHLDGFSEAIVDYITTFEAELD